MIGYWIQVIIWLVTLIPGIGVFEHGWETEPIEGVSYQQTYIGACDDSYVLPHRLEQMHGNRPFIYVENSGHPLDAVLDGTLDHCWSATLARIPEGTVVAPIAEANGNWTSYDGTPEKVAQAYERIQSLTDRDFRWCGSFTIMDNIVEYMQATAHLVDVWCHSVYDPTGEINVAWQVLNTPTYDKPVIIAQTGTVREDKAAWLASLRVLLFGKVEDIIYFNHLEYKGEWRHGQT